MLEQYFIKPETLDRIRGSWLGEPIENYVTWLTEQGYAARNVHRRVPMLMHFAEFTRNQGAIAWEELPGFIDAFVEHWVRTRRRRGRSKEAKRYVESAARVPVEQMLRLLLPDYSGHRRIPLPPPFIDTAPGFFDYLREERGLRELSIRLYIYHLRRFEAYLKHIELDGLRSLSPALLSAFTMQSSRDLGKNALNGLCGHLRIFLRYLYRERLILRDLSASIDCPRLYRLSSIPRSIAWDEVQRVLESVDRRTSWGKRDYAILLLLVTYGMRAREIAALSLDSIDWRRERLQVPDRKAGHHTAFPLSSVVGEALVDYLQNARPQSPHRTLFLCTKAPYRPVNFAVISQRTCHHLRNAGIPVARPGSHTLRHTCVQRLVEAHFPLKAIGDYIGHSRPKSTEIYTKIDLEALRDVALGEGEAIV